MHLIRTRIKPDGIREYLYSKPAPESVTVNTHKGPRTVPCANRPGAKVLVYQGEK